MPNSYTFFKNDIKEWFIHNVPLDKKILDVGPGEGTYSILLRDAKYRMDAVEIWAPYIDQFNLQGKYDNVYVGDILTFDVTPYDFIILGDVLEHIPTDEAQKLLAKFDLMEKRFLVAVPYMMPQDGEEYGNEYETHHQEDLTPDVMLNRYPGLVKLYDNQWYGYYVNKDERWDRGYVLYATESYKDTVQACVNSIRTFSELPIIVYMLNSDVEIDNAITLLWDCKIKDLPQQKYIDRSSVDIYNMLIQRPLIVKDALKHIKTVAYVDSDSVATKYVDRMFDYFPEKSSYPYFTEGIYEWMIINGRGGVETRDDMSTSLEHAACQLFDVDQSVRDKYRQTGYFVAGEWCREFLDEWWWMCNHPKVLQNTQWYAPYHEETIANVLLWKYKYLKGLPYIYINGSLDRVNNIEFVGYKKHIDHFVATPLSVNELFFYHGEKDAVTMYRILERQKNQLKILFLAPHLSTGGMPAFLLKRIQALLEYANVKIIVVEYSNHSDHFVVQKDQIKQLAHHFYTLGENKMEIVDIINRHGVDIVHVDEMVEDGWNNWSEEVRQGLYNPDRTWRMIETCHNIIYTNNNFNQF